MGLLPFAACTDPDLAVPGGSLVPGGSPFTAEAVQGLSVLKDLGLKDHSHCGF